MITDIEDEQARRAVFKEMFNFNRLQMVTKPELVLKDENVVFNPDDALPAEVREAMSGLIGMHEVKRQFASFYNVMKLNRMRQQYGMKEIPIKPNIVMAGNPGTGKSTVARIAGKLLKQAGILKIGHVVEITPSDLFVQVAVGGEAKILKNKIKEAAGGILMIDEIQMLFENNGKRTDYWRNVTGMISHEITSSTGQRCGFVFSGQEEGINRLFRMDPSLNSRFPNFLYFRDNTSEELTAIYELFAKNYGCTFASGARETLQKTMTEIPMRYSKSFGNGRYAENLFTETISCIGNRVAASPYATSADISTITMFDINLATTSLWNKRDGKGVRYE